MLKTHPWLMAEKASFWTLLFGLYFFGVRGVFRADMRNAAILLLLGITLYFLAVTGLGGGLGGDARFRLPIMPAVCIFAAAGLGRKKAIVA